MKFRYTKYTGDLLDEIDLEDLVSKLSDLLLSSGFSSPWGHGSSGDEDRTLEALHDAILEALFSGGVLSEEALDRLLGEPADGDQDGARQQLDELIEQIIQRMMERGFITDAPDLDSERMERQGWRRQRRGRPASRSRSPTRRSTSWATAPCATCWARWAAAARACTTRVT